jgi:hypothetical protein
MQDDVVEQSAAEGERVGAERHQAEWDGLVEAGIETQERIGPGWAVVADDGLPLPQAAHQADEVLELGGGDAGQPHGVKKRWDTATETKREAPPGHAMHRCRV